MAYYTANKCSGGLGGDHGGLSEDYDGLGNCGSAKQQAGSAKAMVIASHDSPEKQQLSKAEWRRCLQHSQKTEPNFDAEIRPTWRDLSEAI